MPLRTTQKVHQLYTLCPLLYQFYNFRAKKLWPIKTSFQYHGSDNIPKQAFFDKDLHLFTMDQDNIDESLKTFKHLYSMRTRKSREYWLEDVSALTANLTEDQVTDQLRLAFEDLILDFDDDLYLYNGMFLKNNLNH